jgi:GMP synthase-like glutamine amidotransferase
MPSATKVSVIQHTAAEYLGLVEDHLEGRRIGFTYHRPFAAGGRVPRIESVGDALIVLGGGPWGAAGPRNVPTLVAEVELVHQCLRHGLPLLGFGLGAQILALASGGRCHAAALELRIIEATRVDDGALGGLLPQRYPQIVYARDRAEPGPDSRVLARDERGDVALFQVGERAFGFSGHPGFKRAMAEDLIMEFDEAPADPAQCLDDITRAASRLEDALVSIMSGLVRATGLMERAGAQTVAHESERPTILKH